VVRLELFGREELEARGRVVAAPGVVAAARERGVKAIAAGAGLCREILACGVSLLYFPFWAVAERHRDAQRRLTLVDGVSGDVVRGGIDPALLAAAAAPAAAEPQVLGLRPLSCPNCGWALPAEAEDVVFCCGSCGRAWEIDASEMHEVPCRVAAAPVGGARVHLPFWTIELGSGRLFLPGFLHPARKLLHDVAIGLSHCDPPLDLVESAGTELRGCRFDRADALRFARFVAARPDRRRAAGFDAAALARDDVVPAALVWLPFATDGYALRSPFTAISIPARPLLASPPIADRAPAGAAPAPR
jgi:hypothetical protein